MIHPPGLSYLPYQRIGIEWMLQRQNVLLADEMGLGKTVQVCGVINNDPRIDSTLVICPASLKTNWYRELWKWCPIGDYGVARGSHWPDTNAVIINYDILHRHHDKIREKTWGLLAVDEAHAIKNIKAQRTKQVIGGRRGRGYIQPIPSWRKILMTGTPIVNRPIEIYPLLRFLDPQRWPDYDSFGERYCGGGGKAIIQSFGRQPNHRNWQAFCLARGVTPKPNPDLDVFAAFEETYRPRGMKVKKIPDYTGGTNLGELHQALTSTVMLRRKKADVLTDLPPKFRQVIELDANARTKRLVHQERSLWQKIAGSDLSVLNEPEYRSAILALESGQKLDGELGSIAEIRRELAILKLPLVIEHLIECLDSCGKVICFCHHRDFAAGLKEAFATEAVLLIGGMSEQGKQEAVDRFQQDSRIRLFIGSKAAKEGLTLTASSHVVIAEPFWVPGEVCQMEDRAHRIGQINRVICQRLVLADSLEVEMAKSNVRKQIIIEQAIDGGNDAYTNWAKVCGGLQCA